LKKRIWCLILFAFVWGCHHSSFRNQMELEHNKIAEVFCQPVFSDEIELNDEDRQIIEAHPDFQNLQKLAEYLDKRRKYDFLQRVNLLLESHYRDQHKLDPTPEEIWELLCSWWPANSEELLAQQEELLTELADVNLSDAEKAEIESSLEYINQELDAGRIFGKLLDEAVNDERINQIDTAGGFAWGFVSWWKFYKAIHAEYGGRVILLAEGEKAIFPGNLPMPCEAINKWVRELERSGDLVFYEPEFRKLFFEENHWLQCENAVDPPEGIFDCPPWLQKQ
jgi:hypothetical protein